MNVIFSLLCALRCLQHSSCAVLSLCLLCACIAHYACTVLVDSSCAVLATLFLRCALYPPAKYPPSLWNATSLSVERWQQQNTNRKQTNTTTKWAMFTEHAGIWCSGGSREIFWKIIFLCLYCRIAAKNKFKYVGETIQSLNIHRWLIKLRNRETTLNRCVNKTCVGFFHFDIVITISAIVHPLFEHGGSWQRWGFDS